MLVISAFPIAALSFAASASRLPLATRTRINCCVDPPLDDLTLSDVRLVFSDVRAHYRETGDVDEGQVCRNMMVTRVNDFQKRINRCIVAPSETDGDGLFATRDIAEGDLISFFPGDALLFWEDGDRTGDVLCTFGAHIPQSDRDAKHILTERVKQYELFASSHISAVRSRGITTLRGLLKCALDSPTSAMVAVLAR